MTALRHAFWGRWPAKSRCRRRSTLLASNRIDWVGHPLRVITRADDSQMSTSCASLATSSTQAVRSSAWTGALTMTRSVLLVCLVTNLDGRSHRRTHRRRIPCRRDLRSPSHRFTIACARATERRTRSHPDLGASYALCERLWPSSGRRSRSGDALGPWALHRRWRGLGATVATASNWLSASSESRSSRWLLR